MAQSQRFPVVSKISLGGHLKVGMDFIRELTDTGYKIRPWVESMLLNHEFNSSIYLFDAEVDLHIGSVSDITGQSAASLSEIIRGVRKLGYYPTEPEDGPRLRLVYTDQARGEFLVLAMNPLTNRHEYKDIFSLRHDPTGVHLDGCDGNPDKIWSGDTLFVFRGRKRNIHKDTPISPLVRGLDDSPCLPGGF